MNIFKFFLVDKTQPRETIKKQYKARVYYFLGLSWLVSFILIFLIPENIMQYSWAQNFVNFMGHIVPMVDGLEQIRLNGVKDEYLARRLREQGLLILPHISFYYALLWAHAWISLPYMMYMIQGLFHYAKDEKILSLETFVDRHHNKKAFYYLALIIAFIITSYAYTYETSTTHWFKIRYVYIYTSGFFSFIFTFLIFAIFLQFFQTHFLIKQQEKNNAKRN